MGNLGLHKKGWGIRKLTRECSKSRNTVRKYVRNGGVVEYRLELVELGEKNTNIVAITAAMPSGTGLKKFGER